MSDHTAAEIFGFVFEEMVRSGCAGDSAKKLWKKSFEYDFTQDQMCCDKALVKLGLAKISKDEDGYEVVLYRSNDLRRWE